MNDEKNEGRDVDNKMPNGGAMGNIDDIQGHPGNGQAPGPAIKDSLAEPAPVRVDPVQARRNGRPVRIPGVPWWAR